MAAPVVLLTGGSGFIGRHLIEELLAADSLLPVNELRIYDTRPLPADFPLADDARLRILPGDIRDERALRQALEGVDLVFHLAAVVDWGALPPQVIFDINVGGTENLLRLAREAGVRALVHASSIDAVYDGREHIDIDESFPYPERYASTYCASKAQGEQLALAADSEAFHTCALRPSDVYGPGDPFHLEALSELARSGFYVRVGHPSKLSMHVYVGNMAHAFAQAGKALLEKPGPLRGRAYFISDAPPSNFFTFFDRILSGAGYALKPGFWLPRGLMLPLGIAADGFTALLRPVRRIQINVSRFSVTYLCTSFTFSTLRAKQDFGFSPKYSEQEAFERTVSYYRQDNEAR